MLHSSLHHTSVDVAHTAVVGTSALRSAHPRRLASRVLRGTLLSSLLLGGAACSDTGSTGPNDNVGTNTGSASAPTGEQASTTGSLDSDGGGLTTGGDTTPSTGNTGLDTTSNGTSGDAQTADAGSEGTTGEAQGDAGAGQDSGGDGGAATTGAVEPEPREDLGEGTGSDVVTIGDSWMSLFVSGIQQSLVSVSGQPYRTYGVPGTRLLNEAIPSQYADAKQADPDIKTVVMTGGGNDIIQSAEIEADCDAMGPLCEEQVRMILDRLESLWAEMAADGVQDVVYVLYANPEGMSIDFALQDGDSAVTRCAAVPEPLRCHTLETLDIVMGDIPDGIHPSAAGYDRIGQAVYDRMVQEGMRR